MCTLFENQRDFLTDPQIETSQEIHPTCNLESIYRLNPSQFTLNPWQWLTSDALTELKAQNSYFKNAYIYRNRQGYISVDNPLIFWAYLRHVVGDEIEETINEHIKHYTQYNYPDDIENDIFYISEYQLNDIYNASSQFDVIEPMHWIETEDIVDVIRNIEPHGIGYNLGLTYHQNSYSIVHVKSTLAYLAYIKHCLGGGTISDMINKIIDSYDKNRVELYEYLESTQDSEVAE